jgi:5-formyltetrahydrofolate cyclo-ligase
MSKKLLREEMMQTLLSLSESYKKKQEQILYNKLIAYIDKYSINSVGIVLSMPQEIDTAPLISRMIENGVKVYNPVCDYKAKTMKFYRFHSFEDTSMDSKGIKVPNITPDTITPSLIVVPGLIFSEDGYRIGYGGGFYDRYLSEYSGKTVSIVLNEQIDEVKKEPHDVPVDLIITPTKTLGRKAR